MGGWGVKSPLAVVRVGDAHTPARRRPADPHPSAAGGRLVRCGMGSRVGSGSPGSPPSALLGTTTLHTKAPLRR